MKQVAIYTAKVNDEVLTNTITLGVGKKGGFNVKSSIKRGRGKGAPKATTGGRGSFDKSEDAVEYFNSLKTQCEDGGWTRTARTSKNAFTTVPTVAELVKNAPWASQPNVPRLVKEKVKKTA